MAEDLAVPGDMRLTVWHGLGDLTVLLAAEVLAVPTGIRGRYDGSGAWLPPESGPVIRFGFSWLALPGASFLAVLGLAERLASHLAAMAGEWPSGTAHTVLLPVIGPSYGFEVTPGERRRTPAPPVPEALASALSAIGAGWAGGFAEQGFEDMSAVVEAALTRGIEGDDD